MKEGVVKTSSKVFIGFSVLSIGYVSVLSMISPQATMEMVGTTLPNTDAISSIRGIYGGVGLVITLSLIYLMFNDLSNGLRFLALFWGAYAVSRMITIGIDGALGDFGQQWLIIESVLCVVAIALWLVGQRAPRASSLS